MPWRSETQITPTYACFLLYRASNTTYYSTTVECDVQSIGHLSVVGW